MRAMLSLLVLLTFLAGCTTPDVDEPPTATTPDTDATSQLPPDIEDTRAIQGGADPGPFVGRPVCDTPSANCQRYPFELNGTARADVSLTWNTPSNDFDLFVLQDGEVVEDGASNSSPPGTSEGVDVRLEPGSYEVVVVPYAVAQDTYTLTVTFSA